MPNPLVPKLSKWPFFAGDALLLAAAFSIFYQSKLPMGASQLSVASFCIAIGAVFGIMPFVLEYRTASKLAESSALTTVVSQLEKLDKMATQISGATGQWQTVQEQADKTAGLAQRIAERMGEEIKAFTEFLQRANDGEKATLRLETEKLHRAERDWIQVLIRMLDHTYALHQGALRSGRQDLIAQLGSFQAACRDAARRVGLTPFAAQESEPFNPECHQLTDGDNTPTTDAVVADTIATGYTFQGKLVRPALVRLQSDRDANDDGPEQAGPQASSEQTQFPLETAQAE
jgi:molecular chaperone GrpE (heat shock protein)